MSRGLVPLVLFPTAGALVLVGSATSTVSLLTILRIVSTRARNVSRQLSRRLSRSTSSIIFANEWVSYLRRHIFKIGASLITLRGAYSLRKSLRDYDASIHMNAWDQEIDVDVKERLERYKKPAWGKGVPIPPEHGVWRPYLHTHMSAAENLEELHGVVGLVTRLPHEMTIDQMTEAVRRILIFKYGELTDTEDYWDEKQARSIAEALARENGLAEPLPAGGLDECVPYAPLVSLLSVSPIWLQSLQRLSLSSMRPFFHAVLSWRSRLIETPFGKIHVLDTSPGIGDSASSSSSPPVLLQHGAFVTGWSMALLGWMLARQGRRVVMPDLFDFDHGYSASDVDKMDGMKVRRYQQHLEALACVVEDMVQNGRKGVAEVDLIGHSFGGIVVSHLAALCAERNLPVRKIVMLAPGGPLIKINPARTTRFMNNPWETLASSLPAWVPFAPVQMGVKLLFSILFSPNNTNVLFGMDYTEYLGNIENFKSEKPVLLLWGTSDSVCRPRMDLTSFLRQNFTNITGFWVEGGDHNIQIDSVVAIAREIDTWLGKVSHQRKTSSANSVVDTLLGFTNRNIVKMNLGDDASQHTPHSRL